MVARAIHLSGSRASGPFIKINCAAIPSELMESELFGHTKGAFTGAEKSYGGKFQAANGGTLFLDEIGDMDVMLQAKLLHVLQDNSFMMLGSNESVHVDVRIISATNQDLPELMKARKFREDLFHRLNVFSIHIPPLRERTDDIPLLVQYFLNEFSQEHNRSLREVDNEAMQVLLRHPWPGNVRELQNILEKLTIFSEGKTIFLSDVVNVLEPTLGNMMRQFEQSASLKEELFRYERDFILHVLNSTGWKMKKSAQLLGFNRSTLFKKMQKFNIQKGV